MTAVVGHNRSSIRPLTEVSMSAQAPVDKANRTRLADFALAPTSVCPTCSSCSAMRALAATISLKVSATLPESPVRWAGSRAEKSPMRTAWSASRSSLRSRVSSAPCSSRRLLGRSAGSAAPSELETRLSEVFGLHGSPSQVRSGRKPDHQLSVRRYIPPARTFRLEATGIWPVLHRRPVGGCGAGRLVS